MYWQEKSTEKSYDIPDTVVDLSFKINCKTLPIDHAWALSSTLSDKFSWLKDPYSAMHLIHGAESGNGWQRPENTANNPQNALLHLSRRSRFTLRLHKENLINAEQLVGLKIDIDGHVIQFNQFTQQALVPQATIFSRYVVSKAETDETTFLDEIASEITALGVNIQKMMGGKKHQFYTPNGIIHTRSLMIADLEKEESILLQQKGVGTKQLMGMGVFLPHKGITAVTEINDSLPPPPEA